MRRAETTTDPDESHEGPGAARDAAQPRHQERDHQRVPRDQASRSRMAGRCPRRLIAVAAILAALGSVSSTSKAAPDTIPRIVVLGDSLTSGRGIARTRAFPALLQAQLIDDGY